MSYVFSYLVYQALAPPWCRHGWRFFQPLSRQGSVGLVARADSCFAGDGDPVWGCALKCLVQPGTTSPATAPATPIIRAQQNAKAIKQPVQSDNHVPGARARPVCADSRLCRASATPSAPYPCLARGTAAGRPILPPPPPGQGLPHPLRRRRRDCPAGPKTRSPTYPKRILTVPRAPQQILH